MDVVAGARQRRRDVERVHGAAGQRSGPSKVAARGLRTHRRAAAHQEHGARVRRQGDRPGRRRELAQPPLRHRPGAARSPTRATWARSSRASTAAPGLDYITYGADRARRSAAALGDAHGDLRADVARLLDDPEVGHRGAEAASYLPQALLGRVAGLLRPDRARHRLRRRQPEDARGRAGRRRAGRSTAPRCGSRWATTPSSRSSSPRPTRRRSTRAWPASWSTPTRSGFQPHGDQGQDGPARRRTPPQIGLDDVFAADDSMLGEVGDGFKVAMSALDSGRYSRRRRLRRHLPGLRRGVGQVRQGARAVRPPDRLLPARAGR